MTNREGERQGPHSDFGRAYLRPDEGDRVRSLKGAQSIDRYYVPPELLAKHPSTSFEWKNYEIYGKPADAREVHFEQQQGWRACPHSMFPGYFAPIGEPGYILVDGMILMERPLQLTQEARREEIARAQYNARANQQRAAETPPGQAPRLRPQFNSQVVPLEIPED
jgi:hypothetical protein